MRPAQVPVALITLVGFIAAIPAVTYYTTGPPADALQTQSTVLVGLAVPVIGLLFLAGWLQPGGG
jgi:Sec-independent protein secretion pathway component TatC